MIPSFNNLSISVLTASLFASGNRLGCILNGTASRKFFNLLIKYQNVFSKNRSDLGKTDLVQHKIDTGDAVPFKMQPRRLPLAKREAVKAEIDRFLRHEKHTCVMGTVYLVYQSLTCP
jgi:hypothetical protein